MIRSPRGGDREVIGTQRHILYRHRPSRSPADSARDLEARAEQAIDLHTTMGREGWRIRTRATTVIRCTAEAFLLEAQLQAWDGDEPIFERRWDHRVPRDQV